MVPDHQVAGGDAVVPPQLLQQGEALPLPGGVQGLGGGEGHVGPQEVPAGAVAAVGDAQLVREDPGLRPGEIRPVQIPQSPEDEGEVVGGGGGLVGAKAGEVHPIGQAVGVGVAHIGLRPVGHVGKGDVPVLGQGLLLGAEQAHQHGDGLGPGGGTVQGELGGAVLLDALPKEEAQVVEQVGGLLGLGAGGPGGGGQGKGQGTGQHKC